MSSKAEACLALTSGLHKTWLYSFLCPHEPLSSIYNKLLSFSLTEPERGTNCAGAYEAFWGKRFQKDLNIKNLEFLFSSLTLVCGQIAAAVQASAEDSYEMGKIYRGQFSTCCFHASDFFFFFLIMKKSFIESTLCKVSLKNTWMYNLSMLEMCQIRWEW